MKIRKPFAIFIALSPFLVGWVALFVGLYDISPLEVLKMLAGWIGHSGTGADLAERSIVIDIRLPRVLLAAIVGASLSTSGAAFQGIFRNPLVDPYILGISAGAALGCALSVAFFPAAPVQFMAFAFGAGAVVLAYGVARTQGEVSRLPLILSGVIVSAFFTAMVSIIKFLVDPHRLQNIVYWLMGSFSLADWRMTAVAFGGFAAGAVPVFLMRWRLNAMSMGDVEAKTLGVNVMRDRLILVGASTLMVSIAVSVSGIIGWIGLMVPHLVRMIAGPDHRSLVPLSMAGGASFLIASDTIARTISTYDLPVGIITAILGAPFFVYLMKRNGREAWGK